ncbi:MAG: DinB family protein [Phycisphaerales bacterium]|nr:DinB family protein [Phycisphaerales bacterium]
MEFDLDRTFRTLARTPDALAALVRAFDPDWTEPDYGPGTWSVREIVAHLVFGEQTDWVPRAMQIIESGDSRPFAPFDRAGHHPLARAHPTDELLRQFGDLRRSNLTQLRSRIDALTATGDPAPLDRRGRHPALGTVTLRQLLATWLAHDLNHIAQACKALAYQHRAEVGPWEAYLSVLSPPNPR